MRSKISGFTLIELTITLFILGLLLSSFLIPLAVRIEQGERSSTRTQLEEIRQALYGFVFKNRRLPCPDCSSTTGNCAGQTSNDGQEDILSNASLSCATTTGNLPWAELGIKGVDAWNNRFTYVVTGRFADGQDGASIGCSATSFVTVGVSFSLCSDGNITIRRDSSGTSASIIAEDIPAIVISHGKNGLNTGANEAENNDNDQSFVDSVYSQTEGSEFDDMLIWISPHIIRTKLVNAGLLP